MTEGLSGHQSQQVDTGGGTYVGDDVNTHGGDFIGRDKKLYHADVGHDQIIAQTVIIYNYPLLSTPASQDQEQNHKEIPTCPYRGLFAFRPEHANYFFGRDEFTQALEQKIINHTLAAILGASGSGKSSVVFAGLVPSLLKRSSEHWFFTYFRPGNDPYLGLANALVPLLDPELSKTKQAGEARDLAGRLRQQRSPISDYLHTIHHNRPDHRLLIIADQFEELYTLCHEEAERHQFLDLLLATFGEATEAQTASHLLLTMRADFLGQALAYRPLADGLQGADLKLGPMNRAELTRAVAEPAQRQGVKFDEKLVERILDDVGSEEGCLPLLEFALTELWQRQRNQTLTHTAYEEIGQAKGALRRHADAVYQRLSVIEQAQARLIFVQLVNPGSGTEDTRRLVYRKELEKNWALVTKLASERLVVTNQVKGDAEAVEVVHEALIRNWPQLREWIDTDREFLTWQLRLRVLVENFAKAVGDEDALLRGALLVEAERWYGLRHNELSQGEKSYIEQSMHLAEQKAEAIKRTQELALAKERQLSRRKTLIIRAMSILLAVLGLVGTAWGVRTWKLYSSPWQLLANFPRDGATAISFSPIAPGEATAVYCVGTRNLGIGCSTDGKSWNIYQQGFATGNNVAGGIEGSYIGNTRSISAVAIDPENPAIFYAYVYDGFIYQSLDSGIHWQRWSPQIKANYLVRIMDVHGPYLAAVVEPRQQTDAPYLLSTGDGGKGWAVEMPTDNAACGRLFDTLVRFHNKTAELYIACETGLFYKHFAAQQAWAKVTELPSVRLVAGRANDEDIYVISYSEIDQRYGLIRVNRTAQTYERLATLPKKPITFVLEPKRAAPTIAYVLMNNNDVAAISKQGEVHSLNALPWWLLIGAVYDLAAVPPADNGETRLLLGHQMGLLEYTPKH